MRFLRFVSWLVVAAVVVGCGGEVPTAAPPGPPAALSVAEWRELPIAEKYDEMTLQRLKMNDANLNTDRGWDRFMIETVIPERKKDLPDDFAKQ